MSGYQVTTPRLFRQRFGQPPNSVPEDTLVHNWEFNLVTTNDLQTRDENIHIGLHAGGTENYSKTGSLLNPQVRVGNIAIGSYAGESNQGNVGESLDEEDAGPSNSSMSHSVSDSVIDSTLINSRNSSHSGINVQEHASELRIRLCELEEKELRNKDSAVLL